MLLDAGIAFLKSNDASDLSVRTLARTLGVSEAAPYHHFADRQAFEHAIMCEGYEVLARRCEAAAGRGKGLKGLLSAYVRFATDHPNLFRLMHRSGAARDPANAELRRVSEAAFSPLLAEVRRRALTMDVTDPRRIGFLTLMVWTQLHGLTDVVLADFLRLGNGRNAFLLAAYAHIEKGLEAALACFSRPTASESVKFCRPERSEACPC